MGEIVIIGCGGRTPLGYDIVSSAAAVRSGISAIAEHPFMIDRFGKPMRVTRDAVLDPELSGVERLVAMTIPAARAAVANLAQDELAPPIALVCCFGEERPGQDAGTGSFVADSLRNALDGVIRVDRVEHLTGGHASGIEAMAIAQRLICEGAAEIVLAGGVDSYLVPETLEWLDEVEQLHSEENIYGFSPGEAAGFVLLAHTETARLLGLAPLLDLVSVGSGVEKNLIKTDDICLGRGLADAFGRAAAPLLEGEQVDRIICDMNGERYRANEYGFAVLKNTGLFKNAADVETPADCWGDVGAASGALYVGLVVEAELRGYANGPISLIWASSEAGQRSAAIFRHPGGST